MEANEIVKNKTKGLIFISELIEAAETDEEIAYCAAGPLENLLNIHCEAIEEDLTVMVRKSFKMRKGIQGVWASGKPREVLGRILLKFNLT